jgi:hypothetical protein
MAEYNPFTDIYAGAQQSMPVSIGAGIFQPAQTTDEYFKQFHPSAEEGYIPSSSMVVGRPQAENTAQFGKRTSEQMIKDQEGVQNKDYFGQALEAITSLNKRFGFDSSRGTPIPIAGGRGLMQNVGIGGIPYQTFRAAPSEYNTIEGRTYTGSQIPKDTLSFGISPEMKASQAAGPSINVPAKGLPTTSSAQTSERDLSNAALPESEIDVERRSYGLKQQAQALRDKRKTMGA